jgi:hypothetical protein
MSQINIDFITKLSTTINSYDSILIFIDRLIKQVYWIAKTKESLSLKKFITLSIDFYIQLHRLLDIIISDRDMRFNSNFWKHITNLWETQFAFSSSIYP